MFSLLSQQVAIVDETNTINFSHTTLTSITLAITAITFLLLLVGTYYISQIIIQIKRPEVQLR